MAEEKGLPEIFAKVSMKTKTPWVSIIAVVLAAMCFSLIGDLKTVANLTNFTVFAVFIFVNAAVIYFRYKKPISTGFLSPISIGKMPVFPLLGILSSLFMIINVEYHILIMGGVLVVTGFLLYYLKQSM